MFPAGSVPRNSLEENRLNTSVARVGAGLNTSTVALQFVGGYEKGTQCLGL
jgi:hypothetical protein